VTAPGYRLVDADNHYYEPRDCFTRHLDPRFRASAVHTRRDAAGREQVWIGEQPCRYLEGVFGFERIARPGSLAAKLRQQRGAAGGDDVEHEMRPEYRERAARLALLDAQGIEAALLFPSLAVCVEPYLERDAAALFAHLRAFNRWLEDDWGFGRDGRLYGAALLSLLDRDAAVAELERVLGRGARVLCIKAGAAGKRSPADPHFDPLWARIEEAGAVVAFHSGNSGYNGRLAPLWGEEPDPPAYRQSAFQWITAFADRPTMDTLAALTLQGLFGRFPGLRLLSVENGSLWLPYLFSALDRRAAAGRHAPGPPARPRERPSELLARHLWVSPFPEDDLAPLLTALGAERVAFGSDFPHPEGLAEPASYARTLAGLSEPQARRILRDNALELLGGGASAHT
jgi:predicted TIM-barrel fold metal-dependent hydrolase